MAINISDVEPRVQYTATSGQTSFTVGFEFFTNTDLKVFNGSSLLSFAASPSDATEYSVTGAGVTGGGSITLGGSGATLNDIITISRDLPIARSTDFPTSGAFQIASLNDELDKLTAMAQQLERDLKFSPRASATTANTFNITFPNLVANKVLSVNSSGNGLEFAQDITDITALAAITSDITAVSAIASDIAAVENIKADITAVANDATDIGVVAAKATEIGRLGTVDAVADLALLGTSAVVADLDAVADKVTEIGLLGNADVIADMALLATSDVISDLNTLATSDIVTDLGLLATSDFVSDLNTLATSGNVTAINNVSGSIASVNEVATNLGSVNDFASRYRVASSDPSSSLDEGDLAYNTTANVLKYYNGSAWITIVAGSLTDIVQDGTPQLGGDLDVQTNSIVTTSNRNVLLAPNGTGVVEVKGNTNGGAIQLNCESNSHGVKLQSPAHSAAQSYTMKLPATNITAGKFLKVDSITGSGATAVGQLSFADVPQPTLPTVADVSQTIAPASATSINITGTNFSGIPIVQFIKSDTGAITSSNTVSLTNATTLAVNVTLASGSYYVRIELENGRAARSTNAILTASTAPSFSTGAGSLGTFAGNFSGTLATISASSDSAITFAETTSVLSGAGVTLNSSTGALTTSDFGASSTTPTTYTFTIRITDAESQTTTREFSMTSNFGATGGGQFN